MTDRVTAIVLAAGRGTRMHSETQKQYMALAGRPVITYALDAFSASGAEDIVLVVAPGEVDYAREHIVERYGYTKVRKIVEGGAERYHSVYRALCAVEADGYVLIHDGARAFITTVLIDFCIAEVKKDKSCVMGMPVKDTIKIVDEKHYALSTPPRDTMWQVQTPQCFLTAEIREAYRRMFAAGDTAVTDDGMVMETYGVRGVRMIAGSYENIKITTPEDMVLGEAILANRRDSDEERQG